MWRLELKVAGQPGDITADAFLRIARDTLKLLKSVGSDRSGEKLSWTVADLRTSSLAVEFTPGPAQTAEPITDLVRGVSALDLAPSIPPGFTDKDLDTLADMCGELGRDGVEGVSFAALNGGECQRVELGPRVQVNAQKAARPTSAALGSVEGRVEMLSVNRKRRASIRPHGSSRSVRGIFSDDLLERLRDHFNTDVRAWGMVHRNAMGEPVKIQVEDFEPVVPTLPVSVEELTGIAPWWTGGMDPVDFVREQRRRGEGPGEGTTR